MRAFAIQESSILTYYPLANAYAPTAISPPLENNYRAVLLDHNVIEQSAP